MPDHQYDARANQFLATQTAFVKTQERERLPPQSLYISTGCAYSPDSAWGKTGGSTSWYTHTLAATSSRCAE